MHDVTRTSLWLIQFGYWEKAEELLGEGTRQAHLGNLQVCVWGGGQLGNLQVGGGGQLGNLQVGGGGVGGQLGNLQVGQANTRQY